MNIEFVKNMLQRHIQTQETIKQGTTDAGELERYVALDGEIKETQNTLDLINQIGLKTIEVKK